MERYTQQNIQEDIKRVYRKQYCKQMVEFIESKRDKEENTNYMYLTGKIFP